jgi:hypothetical protein
MADRALVRELGREWESLRERLSAEARPPSLGAGGRPLFAVSPAALFAQLEEVLLAWRELREAPLEAYQDRYVNAAWTLKDLLGHLASWAGEFRRQVETVAEGRDFDYVIPYALSVIGPNEWNARAAEGQRPRRLAEVLDEFETETRRLQDLVLALPDTRLYAEAAFPAAPSGDPAARWRGNVAQLVLGKCEHDRYHLGPIRGWLAKVEQEER